jgi:MYXO-CTERM domain-containing protein
MKRRTLAAIGVALAAGAVASADTVINTDLAGAGINAHGANPNLHLMQEIIFDQAYNLESISVNVSNADFNLYLARNVGDTASDAVDIMWSSAASSAESGYHWVDLDATGAQVDAGSYFLIMTSEGNTNWRRALSSAAGNQGLGATGLAVTGLDTITEKSFLPGSSSRVYSVRVEADVIPAPGAIALFGLGGLAAVRRRR